MELYRWLGLLSVFVVIALGIGIFLRDPQGKESSFSAHIASSRRVYLLFAIVLTLFGTIFCLFFALWVVPNYAPDSAILNYSIPLSWVCILFLSWVPDSPKNNHHAIHFFFGGVLVVLLGCQALLLAYGSSTIGPITYWAALGAGYFAAACVVLYVFVNRTHSYFLYFEATFILFWVIYILAIIFRI